MVKRKASTSTPQSPAQNGKREVARQEASPTYVTSGEDEFLTPNTSREGRPTTTPNKGKQRAETDDEDSGSQFEAPSQESSRAPSPSPSPSPEPPGRKSKAANQNALRGQGGPSKNATAPIQGTKKAAGTNIKPTASNQGAPPKKATTQDTNKVAGNKKAASGSGKSEAPRVPKFAKLILVIAVEAEFGTRKQCMHVMVFGVRSHLDNIAELEEIITMRLHSERAMYNAKAKAHKQEQRSKEMDIEIQKLNLKRLEHMSPEVIMLEFENRILDKNKEVALLQEKLIRLEISTLEVEKALENEKAERIKAERDFLTVQEIVLREQRAARAAED
ncbi:unnamed protein product [Rhizoctonia solani]|uniref:Uncharacterized protein n=1 Tax=Rhizoctonia solani TaxID=456999 RepID=A0A8H3DR22_9AGAM|nr:unnamed protein product [Rhizoctonia solani]CAE6537668.1 unnamed protein product [Rhizoctonia solani]